MDLYNSVRHSLDRHLFDILSAISEEYNIDMQQLEDIIKSSPINPTAAVSSINCMHILTRGKNKGMQCSKKALENGFCGTHQQHASFEIQGLAKRVGVGKPKPMTKTQLQIIEMLSTAVPQQETVLKRQDIGLVHEETDIVFDENFMVIGRKNGTDITKLSKFELNLCETNGWKYSEDAIDNGSESEED